jgi:hypothetical protein
MLKEKNIEIGSGILDQVLAPIDKEILSTLAKITTIQEFKF